MIAKTFIDHDDVMLKVHAYSDGEVVLLIEDHCVLLTRKDVEKFVTHMLRARR